LPRKARYKKRNKKPNITPTNYAVREGRTYADFLKFSEEHSDKSIVEMDTVIGKKGGKTRKNA